MERQNGKEEEGAADLKEGTLSKWQRNCHWKPDLEDDNDGRIRKLHLRDMKTNQENKGYRLAERAKKRNKSAQ